MSNLSLCELVNQFGASRAVSFQRSPKLEALDAILTPQLKVALEIDPNSQQEPCLPQQHLAHVNRMNGMGLCFSTTTALQGRVSAILAQRLHDLLGMSEPSRNALRTVLHETLVNAAVHGSMGLHSPKITNLADYGTLHQAIETQKNNSTVMGKRITVAFAQCNAGVAFTVCDEGLGFDTAILQNDLANSAERRANGRGLFLVKAMTHDMTFFDNGSTIQFTIAN